MQIASWKKIGTGRELGVQQTQTTRTKGVTGPSRSIEPARREALVDLQDSTRAIAFHRISLLQAWRIHGTRWRSHTWGLYPSNFLQRSYRLSLWIASDVAPVVAGGVSRAITQHRVRAAGDHLDQSHVPCYLPHEVKETCPRIHTSCLTSLVGRGFPKRSSQFLTDYNATLAGLRE